MPQWANVLLQADLACLVISYVVYKQGYEANDPEMMQLARVIMSGPMLVTVLALAWVVVSHW